MTGPASLAQPPLAVEAAGLENGAVGPVEAALVRSVTAGRQARTITARDDAAVAAARSVARSLDQAIGFGATLETVIKGTTALRAYLAALNLTPASRDDESEAGPVDHTGDDTPGPDWVAGAAAIPNPADTGPA